MTEVEFMSNRVEVIAHDDSLTVIKDGVVLKSGSYKEVADWLNNYLED